MIGSCNKRISCCKKILKRCIKIQFNKNGFDQNGKRSFENMKMEEMLQEKLGKEIEQSGDEEIYVALLEIV